MLPEQTPPVEELENPPGRAGRFVPWLFALALGLLFIPVYLASSAIQDSMAPLSTEAEILQATITAPPPVPADEAALAEQLLSIRSQLAGIANIPPTLVAAHIDWPSIMLVIRSYDADLIRLTGFTNQSGQLVLEGGAMQEGAVLDYAHSLERTGYFLRVNVQSITINPQPPPTVAPTESPEAGLPQIYMPFIFTLSIDMKGATT